MQVSREVVEKSLTKVFTEQAPKVKETRKNIEQIRKEFGYPATIVSDYITLRKNLIEVDDFMIFALTKVYLPKRVEEWFTPQEVKHYSKDKFTISKVKFPLRYKMIQIRDDQYIGKITVKELMQLRDAQLINYNENAQRTMTHTVKNGQELYQIALNKTAVKNIMQSYESDRYIPDVITLNIPDDELDWYYDDESMEVVIKSLKAFDIIDGYHRYVAMSKELGLNREFDYEMEFRITNFPESKAQDFIWQQDQKTKMSKVNSDSFDSSKLSNRIVSRMNTDRNFVLNNKISRNNGIINSAIFAMAIDKVWLKGVKKSEEMVVLQNVQKKLTEAFEELYTIDPKIFTKSWDKKLILTAVYESRFGSMDKVLEHFALIKDDKTIFGNSQISTTDITRMQKLFE